MHRSHDYNCIYDGLQKRTVVPAHSATNTRFVGRERAAPIGGGGWTLMAFFQSAMRPFEPCNSATSVKRTPSVRPRDPHRLPHTFSCHTRPQPTPYALCFPSSSGARSRSPPRESPECRDDSLQPWLPRQIPLRRQMLRLRCSTMERRRRTAARPSSMGALSMRASEAPRWCLRLWSSSLNLYACFSYILYTPRHDS